MFFSMGRAFLTCVNSLMCPYTCGLIILTDIVFCTRNGRTRGEDETTDCRHCVYGRAICYCLEDMQPLCAGQCRRTEVVKAMYLKLSCLVLHVLRSCCLPYLSLSFSFRKSSIKRIALLVAMARLMSRPKFSVSLNVRMSSFEP